jgi:DNA-binding SARP family transcriptional activator
MEFRILGPLEVASDDDVLEVHGAKTRALLALFLVHANQVVAQDRLIDDLWEGAPPNSATPTLQTYVSQLRKSLPLASLLTRPAGYVLEVAPGDVDAQRFEDALLEVSRSEDASADWVAARLGEALSWWRGPALADFEGATWAEPEVARLEGLRLAAIERRTDARLALGQHADLVPELETLATEHPLREALWAQLMLALYRSDRQADALRTYQRLRSHLGEELGIEPSKELVRLEEAILLQRPELDWQASPHVTEPLPSGVVTFLLSDIVGSASLWEQHPEAMAGAVARHDELMHDAVAAYGGTMLKTRGESDSTFFVFSQATDALAAALSAQRALRSEAWPESTPLLVRMALHTGEAYERDGNYHGPTVDWAVRIQSLGTAGEILVSRETGEIVRDDLPAPATLVDLCARVVDDALKNT